MKISKKIPIQMFIFIGCVVGGVASLSQFLYSIFLHNLLINSLILGGTLIGALLCVLSSHQILKEQKWLLHQNPNQPLLSNSFSPRLLYPLLSFLSKNESQRSFSFQSVKNVLSSLENRLDSVRDPVRYLSGILIFLGLLGTFWGLSKTISAITSVISGLDLSAQDVKHAIEELKTGLQSPLKGMGSAFSCSLFGLSGSLIVSFLDFRVGKMTSNLYCQAEDWLTARCRPDSSFQERGDFQASGPALSMALLENTLDAMSQIQMQLTRGEENKTGLVRSIQTLTEKMIHMTELLGQHQSIVKKIAQNQIDLQSHVKEFSQKSPKQDEVLQNYLRNLDVTANKLLEEIVEGRKIISQEIRQEIRVVSRTLSAIANGQDIAAA